MLFYCMAYLKLIYCHVPEGRGLHKTARPPGRDQTRSVNPYGLRGGPFFAYGFSQTNNVRLEADPPTHLFK